MIRTIFFVLGLAVLGGSSAQTVIPFWHSQDATQDTIAQLADDFNASQSDYRVVPEYAGNYEDAAIQLASSLDSGNEPVLFDSELTVFARLVEEGALAPLSDLAGELSSEVVDDFYPALWGYGDTSGDRYGLPWNMSVPVLFYNASAFGQRGVEAPATWDEFEAAADRMTTRQTTGYIHVTAALIFETMVVTRGGQIVTDDGQPNFTSDAAVETLEMLQRMVEADHATVRTFAQLDAAVVDFVRTRGMMAFASIAFWPQSQRYDIAFNPEAAPVPKGSSPNIPLLGAQLVILDGASDAQRRGAFEFWRFLVEPENIDTWVRASYFLPVRRSAVDLLQDWYDAEPARRIGLQELENAVPRPRVGAYTTWQGYLEEAIERALRRGTDPREALAEAQRRAEQSQ
ncbi:MAG: ABC transporter substrate-binding protein [Trueperaceae bacterium]|nr:ABC transporter substrate-binding protein [Trueperaceae bacterium]